MHGGGLGRNHAASQRAAFQQALEQLRQGAAHAAPADALQGVDGRVVQRGHMLAHEPPLLLSEGVVGLGGHGQHCEEVAAWGPGVG